MVASKKISNTYAQFPPTPLRSTKTKPLRNVKVKPDRELSKQGKKKAKLEYSDAQFLL